jgi:hypothetical protein
VESCPSRDADIESVCICVFVLGDKERLTIGVLILGEELRVVSASREETFGISDSIESSRVGCDVLVPINEVGAESCISREPEVNTSESNIEVFSAIVPAESAKSIVEVFAALGSEVSKSSVDGLSTFVAEGASKSQPNSDPPGSEFVHDEALP